MRTAEPPQSWSSKCYINCTNTFSTTVLLTSYYHSQLSTQKQPIVDNIGFKYTRYKRARVRRVRASTFSLQREERNITVFVIGICTGRWCFLYCIMYHHLLIIFRHQQWRAPRGSVLLVFWCLNLEIWNHCSAENENLKMCVSCVKLNPKSGGSYPGSQCAKSGVYPPLSVLSTVHGYTLHVLTIPVFAVHFFKIFLKRFKKERERVCHSAAENQVESIEEHLKQESIESLLAFSFIAAWELANAHIFNGLK